jgi:hypothetical protein
MFNHKHVHPARKFQVTEHRITPDALGAESDQQGYFERLFEVKVMQRHEMKRRRRATGIYELTYATIELASHADTARLG